MIHLLPVELLLEILYFVDYLFIPFLPFVNGKLNDIIKQELTLRCLVFDISTEPFHLLKSAQFFEHRNLVRYLFNVIKPIKLKAWPSFYRDNPEHQQILPKWFIKEFIFPHSLADFELMTSLWKKAIQYNQLNFADKIILELKPRILSDSWTSTPQFPPYQRMIEDMLISQCLWDKFDQWFGRERRDQITDKVFCYCVLNITDVKIAQNLVNYWCKIRKSNAKAFWKTVDAHTSKNKQRIFINGLITTKNLDYLNYLFDNWNIKWFEYLHSTVWTNLNSSFYHFIQSHYTQEDIIKHVNDERLNFDGLPLEFLLHYKNWHQNKSMSKRIYQKAIESGERDKILWFLNQISEKEIPQIPQISFLNVDLIPIIDIILETGAIDMKYFSSHCTIQVSDAARVFYKYNSIFDFQISKRYFDISDLVHLRFWYHFLNQQEKIDRFFVDSIIRDVFYCYKNSTSLINSHIIANFLKLIKSKYPEKLRADLYRCGLDGAMESKNSYSLVYFLRKKFKVEDEFKTGWLPLDRRVSRKLFLTTNVTQY